MKIWIVNGTTGEYSDRIEWVVDAWRTETAAQRRVLFLKQKMLELGASGKWDSRERESASRKMQEFDPVFSCDYTGSDYYITEVELKDDEETA